MTLTFGKVALVFGLLACENHGRRLLSSQNDWRRKALTKLLMAFKEPTAFNLWNPTSANVHPSSVKFNTGARVACAPQMARIFYPDTEDAWDTTNGQKWRGIDGSGTDKSEWDHIPGIVEGANVACLVLPDIDYPGEAPELIGGEMQMVEREDRYQHHIELFLEPDGTVTLGRTDYGTDMIEGCGFWQCGARQFQMIIQRTYEIPPVVDGEDDKVVEGIMPPSADEDEEEPEVIHEALNYTVIRTYVGWVNPESEGLDVVSGSMRFYDYMEDDAADLGHFVLHKDQDISGLFGPTLAKPEKVVKKEEGMGDPNVPGTKAYKFKKWLEAET